MNKVTVQTTGDIGSFDLTDKSDPLYYIAHFSHTMAKNFYQLNQNSFEWRQNTQTDMNGIETLLDTWMGNIATWFDTAVEDSMEGDPIASIPSPPDFHTTYEATDAGVSVWWLIIKFCLWYVLLRLRKSLEGGTDVTEVANILRKALLSTNESEEEYSNLILLAQQAVRIIISQSGDMQDFLYTSEPSG